MKNTAFILLALGGNVFAHHPSAKTELICTSEYGRSSVRHVQTHTSTHTKPYTYTELVTRTPIVTVRLPPKTKTLHKTKTVIQLTQCLRPMGLSPVQAEPGYVSKHKRAEYVDLQKKAKNTEEQCTGGIVVKTIIKTAQPATRTLGPFISTTTVPITTTSTSTIFPADITSTVTAVTSATITSTTDITTSTVTTTSTTVTSQAPTVTVYLACAQDNIASTANGGAFISNVGTSAAKIVGGGNGGDAFACCNACQATPFCQATLSSEQEGFCLLLTNKDTLQQCNPGQFYGDAFLTNPNPSFQFTVSNGPCGAIRNAGSAA
ncbi:hypothetical protein CCMA1212_008636 [Trichoderma ghanense]|uniref:Apple domain-containing protein n=1 Tax=Trichoderma ghanense TaxID=65468 RepID=A0ABY2GVL2_9HYPO